MTSAIINRDLGISPNDTSSITGPCTVTGATKGAAAAAGAKTDLGTAYNTLAGLVWDTDLTGQDLGGMTLTPGVYRFSSSAQLTGTLTLNAQDNPNAVFVFQIGSTLTTGSNAAVSVVNAGPATGCGVSWQVGSSATLGTGTALVGNVIALASNTLNTGAFVSPGRVLARDAAVTLDTSTVSNAACGGYGGTGLPDPTVVVLTSLRSRIAAQGVDVVWQTASEVGTVGFNIYRKDIASGNRTKVNRSLVAALAGSPNGGRYAVRDPNAAPSLESEYVLEEIETSGSRREYGPFLVRPQAADGSGPDPSAYKSGWVRLARIDDPGTSAGRGTSAVAAAALTNVVPGGVAARVIVSELGLQAITSTQVGAALGISESAARNLISGRKLAITGPYGAVACNAASDGSRLYFVGAPVNTTWANTTVYWLTRGRCVAFGSASGSPPNGSPSSTASIFNDAHHAEQNTSPATGFFHDPDADFWVWNVLVAGDPDRGVARYDVVAPDATGGGGTLTVKLQGASDARSGHDHHVAVRFNSTLVGEMRWTGVAAQAATLAVPAGLFRTNGTNTLELTAMLDTGVDYSVIAMNSFDFTWERRARAVKDRLMLPPGMTGETVVDGYSGSDVWILDLANPARPVLLSGVQTISRGDGTSYARFAPPARAGLLLALRPSAASTPAVLPVAALPALSTLAKRGADYLVITSSRLAAAAGGFASLHQGQGLRTAVVTVEQIYDEYTGGNATPTAIRTFLTDVDDEWQHVPRFVVLAGSGTYDGRNLLGIGDNHVPPLLIDTPYGLASSDVALADIDDDGVPEFAIGRISAADEGQLLAYLSKLAAYGAARGAWTRKALFVADNSDYGGDFITDTTAAIAQLKGALVVETADLAPGDTSAARAQIVGSLNTGVALFHYYGHAGADRLAGEGLLTSADVDVLLVNSDRTPLAMMMTCVAGTFGYPGYDSIGVRLTKKIGGGSIATLAPSSLALQSHSRLVSESTLALLRPSSAGRKASTIGEAVQSALATAKASGVPKSTLLTYNLFGDPAIKLKR